MNNLMIKNSFQHFLHFIHHPLKWPSNKIPMNIEPVGTDNRWLNS